jgi:hypothetical protein
MKNAMKICISAIVALSIQSQVVFGQQTIDDERMNRDIEVAENVLATLIKQEFDQGITFFGLDVKGSYQPGYGVTFRVPSDQSMPFFITGGRGQLKGATVITGENGYSYSFRTDDDSDPKDLEENVLALKDRKSDRRDMRADSARASYNERIIRAAQSFILDYGDFISQLGSDERIVVTNQMNRDHYMFNPGKRARISVEGRRADVTAFRQGKLSREQALKTLTIVNAESVEAKEPDLEMLSSIFSRLYRPDLSRTYFAEGNVYYERLKDFGTIFYMQMVSSVERNPDRHTIPTLGMDNVDKATRDKKVTELYPAFEQDIKQNILDYGRTVKSLKDEESLIFNIALTKCKGCGIPSTLELAIKGSVLRDFSDGKIDKNAALNKFIVKRGEDQ